MLLSDKYRDMPSYRCLYCSWKSLDPRISTNVYPRVPVAVRVIELSFPETFEKLVVVASSSRNPQKFVTALRRQGSTLKNRQSAAHDNRVSLKHTPWKYTTAVIDHRMCETIGRTGLGLEQHS